MKETAIYHDVWLLGHYDSRGGCTAYVGMERFEAVHELAKAFGWSPEESVEFNYNQLRNAEDDVMGNATVRFVGTPPPVNGEDVLYGRENTVDLVRRVKQRGPWNWEENRKDGDWEMEVVIIDAALLREMSEDEVQDLDVIEWEGEQWEVNTLGEDAFGLLWVNEKEDW